MAFMENLGVDHVSVHSSQAITHSFHFVGRIDIYELRLIMSKLHRNPNETELREMISSVDDNGDGAIDFDEFLVLMKSRVGEGGPDKDLRHAFSQFDTRQKGYIDRESLKLIMAEFDQPLTEDECNAIFAEADTEKRGRITFQAFKELMVSL
jgi:Ca2+-binding EF-hand superfamily protein